MAQGGLDETLLPPLWPVSREEKGAYILLTAVIMVGSTAARSKTTTGSCNADEQCALPSDRPQRTYHRRKVADDGVNLLATSKR